MESTQRRFSLNSSISAIAVLIVLIGGIAGCDSLDSYDVLALSPEELLSRSEVVAKGTFVRTDTIETFGQVKYLGLTCTFVVVQYVFSVADVVKAPRTIDTLYLWNLDYYRSLDETDVFGLKPGLWYLVYGNVMDSSAELTGVAYPQTARHHPGHVFDDWDRADSVMTAQLPQSQTLSNRLEGMPQNCIVIAGTDNSLSTLFLYSIGELHYYDGRKLYGATRSSYLDLLRKANRSRDVIP